MDAKNNKREYPSISNERFRRSQLLVRKGVRCGGGSKLFKYTENDAKSEEQTHAEALEVFETLHARAEEVATRGYMVLHVGTRLLAELGSRGAHWVSRTMVEFLRGFPRRKKLCPIPHMQSCS